MARLLILGGGARGRWLAEHAVAGGNVARVVTRDRANARAIEAVGAECWIGDPNRLATVVGALDGVAIACWLLGCATGEADDVQALHGALLESFLSEAVDTTMRGFVYETAGTVAAATVAIGTATVRRIAETNSIPLRLLDVPAARREEWRAAAGEAVAALLA